MLTDKLEGEVREVREELRPLPPGWKPVQWTTVLTVKLGQAAHAASVLDGQEDPYFTPEEAAEFYRGTLKAIAAGAMDAIEVFDNDQRHSGDLP